MNELVVKKISGICGILLPIVLLIMLFIAVQQAPWFSLTDNAISDLGKPEHNLSFVNYSFVVMGVLILLFSIGLYFSFKKVRAGSTLLSISSIYFVAAGFVPLPDINHVDASALFFIAFPFSFLLIGLIFYKEKKKFIKKMGLFALLIASLSGISPIFLLFYSGIAIPELIILLPGFSWCLVYGLHLLNERE